jgi:hypothetical protein
VRTQRSIPSKWRKLKRGASTERADFSCSKPCQVVTVYKAVNGKYYFFINRYDLPRFKMHKKGSFFTMEQAMAAAYKYMRKKK